MKSAAHVFGHPIHPMLIAYPFALLSSALAFELGARFLGRRSWGTTAAHLTTAGLGTAVAAAVPGVVDYFAVVPRGSRARRSATQHALCNVSALACFAVAHSRRAPDGSLPRPSLALAALGTGLLALGGWWGGELVYHEHIAVVDEPRAKEQRLERGRRGGDVGVWLARP